MRLYTDAARDGEVAGLAWHLNIDGESYSGKRFVTDGCSSMEAEYFALLDGLRHARRYSSGNIEVFTDCQPLVEKMNVPSSDKVWYERRRGCHRLLQKFDEWVLEWTPRSSNSRADRLAYEALEEGRRS